MRGVSKAYFRQKAEDAKVFHRTAEQERADTGGNVEPTTITGRLSAELKRTLEREGGLEELVEGHIDSLIESVEVGRLCPG